jgi:hypothetical protein
VKRLVIDEKRVPKRAHVFCVRGFFGILLVADEVFKEAAENAKMDGVYFVPAAGWPRNDRGW